MKDKKKVYSGKEKQAFYAGYGLAFSHNASDLIDNFSDYSDSFLNGFNKGSDELLLKGRKKTAKKPVKKYKGR